MTTFLEFLEAAADFALTLNLKAAIVATGFPSRSTPAVEERLRLVPPVKE
jgi:hypothetical protein